MKQDKIINLIGASGSGKTTIAKELAKNYHIIQSYTSRNPRSENEWGHLFISDVSVDIDKGIVHFKEDGQIKEEPFIAYFDNYEKHEQYFATENQYKGKGISIYIVDAKGAQQVKQIVKDIEVVTIYLSADESTRKQRLSESREPREVISRLKTDREIFNKVQCDYSVNANRELEDVLKDVLSILSV